VGAASSIAIPEAPNLLRTDCEKTGGCRHNPSLCLDSNDPQALDARRAFDVRSKDEHQNSHGWCGVCVMRVLLCKSSEHSMSGRSQVRRNGPEGPVRAPFHQGETDFVPEKPAQPAFQLSKEPPSGTSRNVSQSALDDSSSHMAEGSDGGGRIGAQPPREPRQSSIQSPSTGFLAEGRR
jgi:hypothetical protein